MNNFIILRSSDFSRWLETAEAVTTRVIRSSDFAYHPMGQSLNH